MQPIKIIIWTHNYRLLIAIGHYYLFIQQCTTMFQGFLFVLLFILASNRFLTQSFDATETNSINGIFAFSRRSFNSAHLTWPRPESNKKLTILVLFLPGDIQTNPGPRHQPVWLLQVRCLVVTQRRSCMLWWIQHMVPSVMSWNVHQRL